MNNWNTQHRPRENQGFMLRECAGCGAQVVSENIICPRCRTEMEPMPAKKPTIKRN